MANVLPYRGDRGGTPPTRVWDLPAELVSDEGEAAAAGIVEEGSVRHDGSVREWSSGWTEGLEMSESGSV
jgi:hypothetical protein